VGGEWWRGGKPRALPMRLPPSLTLPRKGGGNAALFAEMSHFPAFAVIFPIRFASTATSIRGRQRHDYTTASSR
jgi:hypothetical protein